MSLRISGKNLDIGDAYRTHVEARVGDAVAKYFDGGFTGRVTLERDGSGFRTDCSIHLDTGIVLQAEGRSQDAHQSFDKAAERVEKRLRRYKRRLKEHHHGRRDETEMAASYVFAAPDEEAEIAPDYNPVIIAEETTNLATMAVKRRGLRDGSRGRAGHRVSQCRPRRHQRCLSPNRRPYWLDRSVAFHQWGQGRPLNRRRSGTAGSGTPWRRFGTIRWI